MSAVAERVERVIAPLVAAEGFDLEAVDVQPAGRRRLVRVLVDRDGGLTLDHVASLTSALSAELDETNAMGEQPYLLEVSSPGVGRQLTLPRHWRRNLTRVVRITTTDGAEMVGRIGASDDDGVAIEPTGKRQRGGGASDRASEPKEPITLAYADISHAHVEVEFSRKDAGEQPTENPDTPSESGGQH